MLGYMHMTFAFGWFLLIVVGKNRIYGLSYQCFSTHLISLSFPLFPSGKETFPVQRVFRVLDGLDTDVPVNRSYWLSPNVSAPDFFGMKKTTKQRAYDLLILTVLWLIFPVRFLAESFTSGLNGGGSFRTHNAGDFSADFYPWKVYLILPGGFTPPCLAYSSYYYHFPGICISRLKWSISS